MTSGFFRSALLLSCAAAIMACDGPESVDDALAVPEWTAELDLRIGSVDDPAYALTWFRSMEVAPSGRMYTVHPQEQVIRVFEADGTVADPIGGPGEGPGEFQNVVTVGWVADTLWALDGSGYRFNQFTEAGEFIKSFTVPFASGDDPFAAQPPRANGLLFDGTVHGAPPAFSSQVAEGTLTHHVPMLMTRDGVVTDTLPRVAFGRNTWAISDPDAPRRGGTYTRQPFADGPLWGYVPSERAVMHLHREAPQTREEAVVRLVKLSFTGDTLFTRSIPFAPVPVMDQEADSLLDHMASSLAGRGFMNVAEGRARQWAELSFFRPAFRPGITQMVLGRDCGIWLREAPNGAGSASWLVLDAGGNPVGRILLPEGLTVMVVDGEYVWGSETDEMDVPYLMRYRVVKP